MTNRLKTPFEKTRDDFEEEFCGEIVEFLIFTLQNVTGAASLKDGCKMPSVHFKAVSMLQPRNSLNVRDVWNGY